MTDKLLVFINGPINSGKSTIASHLAGIWPNARHIEGDEVVSRDGLSFEQWITCTIRELAERGCREAIAGAPIFISYPLREEDWSVISKICQQESVKPICVTLAPAIQTALSKRSDRTLEDWEKTRIEEMYREGYVARKFSSLTIDNTRQTIDETTLAIRSFLVGLLKSSERK